MRKSILRTAIVSCLALAGNSAHSSLIDAFGRSPPPQEIIDMITSDAGDRQRGLSLLSGMAKAAIAFETNLLSEGKISEQELAQQKHFPYTEMQFTPELITAITDPKRKLSFFLQTQKFVKNTIQDRKVNVISAGEKLLTTGTSGERSSCDRDKYSWSLGVSASSDRDSIANFTIGELANGIHFSHFVSGQLAVKAGVRVMPSVSVIGECVRLGSEFSDESTSLPANIVVSVDIDLHPIKVNNADGRPVGILIAPEGKVVVRAFARGITDPEQAVAILKQRLTSPISEDLLYQTTKSIITKPAGLLAALALFGESDDIERRINDDMKNKAPDLLEKLVYGIETDISKKTGGAVFIRFPGSGAPSSQLKLAAMASHGGGEMNCAAAKVFGPELIYELASTDDTRAQAVANYERHCYRGSMSAITSYILQ